MTVRLKIIVGFLAVILVANSILSYATVKHVGRIWRTEVQTRVRLDLNSARAAYENHLTDMLRFLQAASISGLPGDLLNQDPPKDLLQRIHRESGLDMLTLVNPQGSVIFRAHNPSAAGDTINDNPLIKRTLESNTAVTGTLILTAEQLRNEGSHLAERARFELLETKAARPTQDTQRTDGMVMAAAVPLLNTDGIQAGILYGADLLNRRYEIVDAIRREVFARDQYQGKHVGTVTVFQGDLRISTNVMRQDGRRAVGTRMSETVCATVLDGGEVYDDRAFVVDDWYITAYEPIREPDGRIIGALYVGLLEAPYAQRQRAIVGSFLAIVVAATLASLTLLFVVTRLVLSPIGRIVQMCRKVIGGDLAARVAIRPPGEMGLLCEAIDTMGQAVAERERQLKLITRQQIGRSEQLAAIGRLSAGIAHEINNPMTAVLTFAHLLRDKPGLDPQDKKDIELIIHETSRVAEIVRGLLDFARERPPSKEIVDINEVIRQILRLFQSQKSFRRITVLEQLASDLPRIHVDRNQLQQVLLNLSLNACEAMPDGGTLTVVSQAKEDGISIAITDTGHGIPPAHLQQIFEPFFTTKPVGKGTGLGLSVSYGIVEQHNGRIEVESEEDRGTTFTIYLPFSEPPVHSDAS